MRKRMAGAVAGLLMGAGGGAVWSANDEDGVEASTAQLLGIAIGTGVGALTGLMIGTSVEYERWEDVSPDDLRPAETPAPLGATLGLSLGPGEATLGLRVILPVR